MSYISRIKFLIGPVGEAFVLSIVFNSIFFPLKSPKGRIKSPGVKLFFLIEFNAISEQYTKAHGGNTSVNQFCK